jgi:phenylacetate-CoA ligase
MTADRYLTDAERFPLLGEAGRRLLRALREHPHAPRYNYEAGERLTAEGLQRLRRFEADLETAPRGWRPNELPPWVPGFAARCLRDVPFYRRGGGADDFCALPTTTRADLAREPWSFVPDDQPLDDLITYPTSGTTGHPLLVPSHPEAAARYVPLLRRALAQHGVRLEGGPGRVAVVLVGFQGRTYTFASVCSLLGEAGFVKLNLNPADWRDPADRARFLDACDPEVYSGDPLSFRELAQLPLRTRPRALVSTAMALLPAWRARLEAHFGCPVVDVYSLNEAGPVAAAGARGHVVLPHDLYVEVLRPNGTPCRPGERGEVALTGGRNPFLPLLRYRTGDWAALEFAGPLPVLAGLEGRPPTVFRSAAGAEVNNIDVTWALRGLPLAQFTLHQEADGALLLRVRGDEAARQAAGEALRALFGPGQRLTVADFPDAGEAAGKVIQYTSDLE